MGQLNHVNLLIRTFNWHTPSWDLFIILFWLVASVLYAFVAGRGRILSILVSVYMSKLLVIEAPFLSAAVAKKLSTSTLYLSQLLTFVVLFLVLFMFISRYAFSSATDTRRLSSIGFSVVFAILQIGLLINIVLSYLPQALQNNFTPLIKYVFIQPAAGFIWLVLPVIFLVALGRFIADRKEF